MNSPIEGNITIVPALSWKSLSRALHNPSATALKWSISLAERSTYACLNILKTRCCIELALNEAVHQARALAIERFPPVRDQGVPQEGLSVRPRSQSLVGVEDFGEAYIPPRRRDVPSSPDVFYSDQGRRRPMCQTGIAPAPRTDGSPPDVCKPSVVQSAIKTPPSLPSPPRSALSSHTTGSSPARSVKFSDQQAPDHGSWCSNPGTVLPD